MLKRLSPLVPIALTVLLAACASQAPQQPPMTEAIKAPTVAIDLDSLPEPENVPSFSDETAYKLPELADSILSHGRSLLGTRYRWGGSSVQTGFDCSGFIGYLFEEEAGLQLPRSTREMIQVDAPVVKRSELEPGDVVFFSTNGRGRVSHAGIYLGDDQFIHSASRRNGVRIDSLKDSYWKRNYLEAKRVLAMASTEQSSVR
ncbi:MULTISPECIES: C40 family peptidase [Pseudomonas]|uniref:C40 family peptidase n=1 Tax=Pseudomonas TaxID=286 RepID=UPI000C0ECE96|nr:peptidase P60 [Pseudomonadaceae bacterium]HCP55644.1 peptidase P60 [Pseudomonas sp.]